MYTVLDILKNEEMNTDASAKASMLQRAFYWTVNWPSAAQLARNKELSVIHLSF